MSYRRIGALTACVLVLATAAGAAPAIENAWFRALPGNLPAAGYFTARNPDARPVVLVGAQSPACGTLMLHMTHHMEGMEHMMAVDHVDIPAGSSVAFAPGGLHLMCMAPTQAMKPGSTVPVTLRFASGATVIVSFAVKGANGK